MKPHSRVQAGFTLVEVLAALVIFGLAGAAVFTAYNAQIKQTSQAFSRSKSQMDIQIAKNLIERDVLMAGFGLADDFTGHPDAGTLLADTRAIGAINGASGASDTLTMMGTALGLEVAAAQGWTVSAASTGPPVKWLDSGRDNLKNDERYVAIDPFKKRIVLNPGVSPASWDWKFATTGASNLARGTVLFGLDKKAVGGGGMPHYWVTYSVLDGTLPATCAAGTQVLRRAETQTTTAGTPRPLIHCVLNMQVAFGLDQNDDDIIDVWDNGGASAAGLTRDDLSKQIKQVRVYVLVQGSNRDPDHVSYSPIRVGDADLGIGEDVALNLTNNQEQYRWELLSLTLTPRNIR